MTNYVSAYGACPAIHVLRPENQTWVPGTSLPSDLIRGAGA